MASILTYVTRGKFYKWDNKDNEISTSDVDKQVATQSKDGDVAACGRSDASSGTEGSLDLYDGDVKVCHIAWDCPWGSKTNIFNTSDIDNAYLVQHTGANLDGGAIGTVTVKVAKIG
jgi:hypothetical protein